MEERGEGGGKEGRKLHTYCLFPFASNRPVPDSGSVQCNPLYGAGIQHRTIRSEWKSTVAMERDSLIEGIVLTN